MAKGYKDLYPYGQDNLGVLYSVQCKKFDMHNYVRRIGKVFFHLVNILLMV